MDTKEFITRYAADRMGTNSLKWDALGTRFHDGDLISMWVADMEFRACDKILEAMQERIRHGVFGYSYVDDEYYNAFFDWEEQHHGFRPQKEWVRFSPGVVVALYWFVNAFTKPQDSVIILTPVYYPFHNAVKDTGRKLVTCDLVNTGGCFTIDYDAFERAIIENDVKLFIQCSPHNPVGRVWTEEELDRVMGICARHSVLVVSDEIHQDIIIGDKKQLPAAIVAGGTYRDNLITVTAASKTFNLAGLPHSHIIISNDMLRAAYDKYIKTVNQTESNIMSITATQAGYLHGAEWLGHVLDVVKQNYEYLKKELNEKAPAIVVSPLEGTYLCLLDLRKVIDPDQTRDFIQDRCRLAVDYGEWFGANFKGFVRLNLATEPRYVEKAAENIIREANKL